jgi:DNA repair exonuclease SbcCD ATPase subunit
MNLSDPRFFTEDDMRAFNAPLQEVAKAAAALNPPKPWLRTVSEIKLDIARWTAEAKDNREGFEGLLPKFKRQLTERLKAREELKAALTRTEGQIEGLRKAGAGPKYPRLLELLGYDFYSKTYQCMQHRTGVLDQIREQLATTELRIESLEEAVKNTQKRVDRELPKLKAELAEAIKREGLLL